MQAFTKRFRGIFQTSVVTDGHPGFDEDEVPPFLQPLKVPMADLGRLLAVLPSESRAG